MWIGEKSAYSAVGLDNFSVGSSINLAISTKAKDSLVLKLSYNTSQHNALLPHLPNDIIYFRIQDLSSIRASIPHKTLLLHLQLIMGVYEVQLVGFAADGSNFEESKTKFITLSGDVSLGSDQPSLEIQSFGTSLTDFAPDEESLAKTK